MVLNTDALIQQLCHLLQGIGHNDIHVIIDGLCSSPRCENTTTALLSIDKEYAQAESISIGLKEIGVSSEIVVGLPLIDQLCRLQLASVVIANCGSGSAKYLWSLNKPCIVINYPYDLPFVRYNSFNDDARDTEVGLIFGRAFRKYTHAPEFYLDRPLLSVVSDESDSNNGYRSNSLIDVNAACPKILEILQELGIVTGYKALSL